MNIRAFLKILNCFQTTYGKASGLQRNDTARFPMYERCQLACGRPVVQSQYGFLWISAHGIPPCHVPRFGEGFEWRWRGPCTDAAKLWPGADGHFNKVCCTALGNETFDTFCILTVWAPSSPCHGTWKPIGFHISRFSVNFICRPWLKKRPSRCEPKWEQDWYHLVSIGL